MTEINRLVHDREAVLTYAPPAGKPVNDVASEVDVAPDKVKWVRWGSEDDRSRGPPPGQRIEAPIGSVRKIAVCGPGCVGRGAAEGAGVGLLVGLALSAIRVATCNPGKPDPEVNPCSFLWIAGPIIGGLVGALVGARGHQTIVDFQRPADEH